MTFLRNLGVFLEKLDRWRDKMLFVFIKPLWPRLITPNHISYFRIVLSLYLFFLIFFQSNTNYWLIMSLFLFGAFTDMLDGSVARGLKKETRWGAMLDPIADRILVMPIAVYILLNHYKLLLAVIVISEIINGLVSGYAQTKNIFIKSNIFGKVKMFLQSVVFVAILIFWPNPPHQFFISLLWVSIIIMAISIFVKVKEVKGLIVK